MKLNRKITLILAMAAAATGLGWSGGQAQTATNLICKGCVGYKDIGKKAIRNKNIDKGTIKPNRLSAPTGAAGTTPLSTPNIVTDEIVRTISVEIPKRGVVVVNASAYFRFDTADSQVTCTITDGTEVDSPRLRANGSTTTADQRAVVSGTRAFVETTKGPKTYNFVCEPGGDDIDAYDAVMTAIYAPKNIQITP